MPPVRMPPLRFRPILKRIRWGGRRLGTLLGKPIGESSDWAESWEIADHGTDQSVVEGGPYDGWTLARLVHERNRELFGKHAGRMQFPLLVKWLDATDRLSVQVHPNDEQARRYDPQENGKTEAWMIVHADPGSALFVGLEPEVDREELQRHLQAGTVEECLHRVNVQPGDCVFIPAGTVHAIGEGIVLAEVQQTSDITFRLYDWGRLGPDGKPRPLHIEQALECIDFERGPVDPVVPTVISETPAERLETLIECAYFVMRRRTVRSAVRLHTDGAFRILMGLSGTGRLHGEETTLELKLGQTVLLPASCPMVELQPSAQTELVLLEAFLP